MMQGFDKMIKMMFGMDVNELKLKAEGVAADIKTTFERVLGRVDDVEKKIADLETQLLTIRAHIGMPEPDTDEQHEANIKALASPAPALETSVPADTGENNV